MIASQKISSPILNQRKKRFRRASPHQAAAAITSGMKPTYQLMAGAPRWRYQKSVKPFAEIPDKQVRLF